MDVAFPAYFVGGTDDHQLTDMKFKILWFSVLLADNVRASEYSILYFTKLGVFMVKPFRGVFFFIYIRNEGLHQSSLSVIYRYIRECKNTNSMLRVIIVS